jgi:hypothetical protein
MRGGDVMLMEHKIAELHADLHSIAFGYYVRKGRVPTNIEDMLCTLECLYREAKDSGFKYRDSQPRVPAGSPEGGQWTDGNNGAEVPDEEGLGHPISPFDLAAGLVAITAFEAMEAATLLVGLARGLATTYRIRRAAKAIEDYLGGKPDRAFPNPAGDIVIMRGDKKIRFDINNYHPHHEPHFHIQRLTKNGNWKPAGRQHIYPFKKE